MKKNPFTDIVDQEINLMQNFMMTGSSTLVTGMPVAAMVLTDSLENAPATSVSLISFSLGLSGFTAAMGKVTGKDVKKYRHIRSAVKAVEKDPHAYSDEDVYRKAYPMADNPDLEKMDKLDTKLAVGAGILSVGTSFTLSPAVMAAAEFSQGHGVAGVLTGAAAVGVGALTAVFGKSVVWKDLKKYREVKKSIVGKSALEPVPSI